LEPAALQLREAHFLTQAASVCTHMLLGAHEARDVVRQAPSPPDAERRALAIARRMCSQADSSLSWLCAGISPLVRLPDGARWYRMVRRELVGKPYYQAPELYASPGDVDLLAADVWALAISFCILCFGGPPMERARESDPRFSRVCRGEVGALYRSWGIVVPPELESLLVSMLKRNPAERPTMQQVLQHPFFQRRGAS
jgi:serine/threonine protein kinase